MSAVEFAARLRRGNPLRLAPLAYGRGSAAEASTSQAGEELGEYYYLQAELPGQLLEEIDLASLPLPALAAAQGQSLRQTQAARVWVSPQGAVSPTHYDASHSILAQVKGR